MAKASGDQKAAASAPVKWSGNYFLYLPGKQASEPAADLKANGLIPSSTFEKHFSFITDAAGNKLLKLNTLDGKNDLFRFPLGGDEKKLTLVFKAKGAVDPDRTTTPYGIFWAGLVKSPYQALLRHNASNQVKGITGQTNLKGNKVSDWHEFRLVFDIAADGMTMSQTAFIDGDKVHETLNVVKKGGESGSISDLGPDALAEGSYLAFGENDGSTNGLGRYPFFLLVKNEDVSGKSLADLGKALNVELAANPTIADADPPSKRPTKKPVGINMLPAEIGIADAKWVDPASVVDVKIDLKKLPFSKNAVQKVVADPKLPADIAKKAAAIVDATGANGAYKTVKAAIDAVKPNSIIYIKPGLYQEKLIINTPGISLIGESPATTVIYGYEADAGGLFSNLLVDVNLPGEGGSFNAENITFYNKGAQWNRTWGSSERRSAALATRNVQQAYIKNCVFLGEQDTMYLGTGRQYFENSYIEGEVDFICGGATVLFNNCQIHSLNYREGGYITAASPSDTNGKGFNNGYVFRDCLITVDPGYTAGKIFLGRGAWQGGSNGAPNQAKVVYIRSQIHKQINALGWMDWDNQNTAAKQFFREYQMTGEGSLTAASATRLFLTDAEYAANYSTTEKILGYTPKLPY